MKINALVPNYRGIAGHEDIYHEILTKIVHKAGFTYEIIKTPFRSPTFLCRFFEFRSVFRKKKEIFFIESFTAIEMIAYILSALLFSETYSQHLLLFRDDLIHQGKKSLISLFFLKLFRFIKKNRFSLLSDSELVANYFIEKNFAVTVFPNPHAQELPLLSHPSLPLVCFWPGAPRKDKGANIIEDLLRHQKSDATLLLSESFPIPPTKINVKRLSSELSRDQYLSCLEMSHIVLLPYDPIAYRCRSSGILVEAVIGGKIPVVTEGTWLSDQLRAFDLEELIVDWQDLHFFDTLSNMVDNPIIRAKLQTMSKAYSQAHNMDYLAALFKKVVS